MSFDLLSVAFGLGVINLWGIFTMNILFIAGVFVGSFIILMSLIGDTNG